MAYETGGRADKLGNRFENNWVLYNLLQVIEEKIQYVMIEAIGEDEEGVDLWIGNLDGSREGQQCKGRYGSEEFWTFGAVNTKGIWRKWKKQLDREDRVSVSLVSPLSFSLLEDLAGRARNTNGSPQDFYDFQIDKSSKENKQFYKNYCKIMEIDYSNEIGISQSIDYLSRTYYKQIPDFSLKETVLDKIHMQFVGYPSNIYAKLLELVLTEDIYSKKIDILYLDNYLSNCGVEYRNLSKDTRIFPRIKELNDEYHRSFVSFESGMIIRREFEKCRKMIEIGQPFILHGDAGVGKSGCTKNIINFCKSENIPYLAIKLDNRIPKDTSELWGANMGLSASPAFCIDAISKDSKAVLIFDQLDALRWTHAHSGNALNVCMQTIKEIENLNKGRKNKICVVFVSRTYDLYNDRGIKKLFNRESDNKDIQWEEIKIDKLDEKEIEKLTGDEYNNLSQKTKKLLATSSNMYIWQHLNKSEERLHIDTTRQLINEWWKQLQHKAEGAKVSSEFLLETKNKMVAFCNDNGRINVSNIVMQIPIEYLDFLQSNGFITVLNELISFTHQSILDTFLSEHMVKEYYSGKDILDILGDKRKQVPGKRYHFQLFMEQMLQDSEKDFLEIGKKILSSESVRFSFKYVFFELLAVIVEPSTIVCTFVCQMSTDMQWGKHIIDNVISGNRAYVDAMQEEGILEKWLLDNQKKKTAIHLYASIAHCLGTKHLALIKKFIFQDDDVKDEWNRCFSWKINEQSDELFDLRIQFYERYPQYINNYFNLNKLFKECEIRIIRLLALILRKKSIYKFEDEFIFEETDITVNEYKTCIDTFLPLLPDVDQKIFYSDWSARFSRRGEIERICVQILKKANMHLVSVDPKEFWNIYEMYMNTGNDLYNEIILDGLYYLPKQYANKIIKYICNDFNLTIFEGTSENHDRLRYGKRLIRKIAIECDEDYYNHLEKSIISYIDKDAVYRLKKRMEYNKENRDKVYWRFWGDFQRDCLKCLPAARLSTNASQLIKMFLHSEKEYSSMYAYSIGRSGGVYSPVTNKTISYEAWRGIITNPNIPVRGFGHFDEAKGRFIEATQEEFAGSLESEIKKEGVPFLEYILNIDSPISNIFAQSIYSAVAHSEQLNEIDICIIESLLQKFGYDYKDHRAISIARIFEKRADAEWSEMALSILFDIAMNHKDPELGNLNIILQNDKELLTVDSMESNAINSVRSEALRAISKLICCNNKMVKRFLRPIIKAFKDPNPIMQYASQFALWEIYNINKKWASKKIIALYKKDARMAGICNDIDMLLELYKDYPGKILNITKRMFKFNDERLIKISGHTIAELYLLYDECTEIVMDEFEYSKEQKEAILEMLITYVGVDRYREKAKETLIYNVDVFFEIEFPWIRLFREKLVDLDRDKDFINIILSSVTGRHVLKAFFDFLEESGKGLNSYADFVLEMCQNLIESSALKNEIIWGYQDDISRMVISLYDTFSDDLYNEHSIAIQCLDLWDAMYEKQIGVARELTKKMMDM